MAGSYQYGAENLQNGRVNESGIKGPGEQTGLSRQRIEEHFRDPHHQADKEQDFHTLLETLLSHPKCDGTDILLEPEVQRSSHKDG
jgi:hypothetical protein